MKFSQFLYGLPLLMMVASCNNNAANTASGNDTTKAVEFAVRTALQSRRPDFDSIRAKFHAGDTIRFTTDSLPLADLPKTIDSIPLKIIDHNELCSTDTLSNQSDDYLYIRAFAKNDTGYYVSVQSLNCQRASNGEALGVFITKKKTRN